MQQEYDYLFKILLIGNTEVGKSSLLLRFADNAFNESFLPTIGVDFKCRTFDLNGKTVKLQIWDTAGQERFKTMINSYYSKAQGFVLVYDITNKQSFKDLQSLLADIEKNGNKKAVKLLIGNKSDLDAKREVIFEEGKALADLLNIRLIETSAQNSSNVEETFISLAKQIIQSL